MKGFESQQEGSVPDMIGYVQEEVRYTSMSAEEIRASLRAAGELVIELSKKQPSSGGASSEISEGSGIDLDQSSSRNPHLASERVGSIASDTRRGVLGHVDVANDDPFGPTERSDSYLGNYTSGSAQRESDTSLLPKGTEKRERGNSLSAQSPENYFADRPNDTSASDYFGRKDSGSSGINRGMYESQKDRMERLIDEAAKFLQEDRFILADGDVYDDETRAAIEAARGAIDEIKYPGGFSKNPLKAAKTLRNVFRFIGDFHKEEVYEAEKRLYPLIIERAVTVANERGNTYNNDQVLAQVLNEARQFLPRSFQAGGGYWRTQLRLDLEDAMRRKTTVEDDYLRRSDTI